MATGMIALNWRKGLARLWVVGASIWFLASPLWTNLSRELSYVYRYVTDSDGLRKDLISDGACVDFRHVPGWSENPYDLAAREVLGETKEPRSGPSEAANAARAACETNTRAIRLDANGQEVPKEDCVVTWLDAYKRAQLAAVAERERLTKESNRLSIEAERRCEQEFSPEPPKFEATLFVLGVPTLGVAAVVLVLMAVASLFRWVGRGFRKP